jgi:hypothetical protein
MAELVPTDAPSTAPDLAGIEITRPVFDFYVAEADERGISREAFRAMVLALARDNPTLLDQAANLVQYMHLSSVQSMADAGW